MWLFELLYWLHPTCSLIRTIVEKMLYYAITVNVCTFSNDYVVVDPVPLLDEE